MIELLDHIMALSFWNKIFLLILIAMMVKALIVCVVVITATIYGVITGEDVIIK